MRKEPKDDRSELANTIEGYLLVRTHQDQARREAEDLCARLPWLTGAQAEDVTRHYLHQRVDLTRRLLQDTVERAGRLRQEYEERYADLRRSLLRRHAVCATALVACTSGIGVLALLFSR
ncbi:hypothetical protein ACFYP4_29215 [Streptomyces sp. NPDC005551]|uniref:hypothetical protein n=1 Tax=Streptomyces sp. NPDC005551 TaxID=3364725 RepID=UPI00369E0D89